MQSVQGLQNGELTEQALKGALEEIEVATNKILNEQAGNENAWQISIRVTSSPPPELTTPIWYEEGELSTELKKLYEQTGSDSKIGLYIHLGYFFMVEQPDGKRRVARFFSSDREISHVQADISRCPSILPAMDAYSIDKGKVAILADFVEGNFPNSPEERQVCSQAAQSLLVIPWERKNPRTPYDFNDTNFKIVTNEEGMLVYYIDQDIPEIVTKYGLDNEVPPERIELLERGRKKLFREDPFDIFMRQNSS